MIEETWSPEPVKAWRYWSLTDQTWDFDTHRWEIQLQGNMQTWEGPAKLAGYHLEAGHESPSTGCMCGINAVKQLAFREVLHRAGATCGCSMCSGTLFWGRPGPRPVVVGEVLLTGVVDEYEDGYRASQAEIVNLVLIGGDQRQARIVAENYGVPVTREPFDGLFMQKLRQEEVDGHREADTPDHRGTGTGQSAGASQGTREGWRKLRENLKEGAQIVGIGLGVAIGLAAFLLLVGLLITAVGEWAHGNNDDAECIRVANETGGLAEELNTFGGCRIVLPNGLIVNEDSFQWKDGSR